ncbi:DNA-3-methyladenine glycosylase I, partial [Mycobacterium tuberculosis]|nr:DNA-3-methyladenine glycosylase I [Mycobacterium tuberculosis]
DVDAVARFTPKRIEKLLENPGIVRNRAKVESAVTNARAVQRIREEHGSLAAFL